MCVFKYIYIYIYINIYIHIYIYIYIYICVCVCKSFITNNSHNEICYFFISFNSYHNSGFGSSFLSVLPAINPYRFRLQLNVGGAPFEMWFFLILCEFFISYNSPKQRKRNRARILAHAQTILYTPQTPNSIPISFMFSLAVDCWWRALRDADRLRLPAAPSASHRGLLGAHGVRATVGRKLNRKRKSRNLCILYYSVRYVCMCIWSLVRKHTHRWALQALHIEACSARMELERQLAGSWSSKAQALFVYYRVYPCGRCVCIYVIARMCTFVLAICNTLYRGLLGAHGVRATVGRKLNTRKESQSLGWHAPSASHRGLLGAHGVRATVGRKLKNRTESQALCIMLYYSMSAVCIYVITRTCTFTSYLLYMQRFTSRPARHVWS